MGNPNDILEQLDNLVVVDGMFLLDMELHGRIVDLISDYVRLDRLLALKQIAERD